MAADTRIHSEEHYTKIIMLNNFRQIALQNLDILLLDSVEKREIHCQALFSSNQFWEMFITQNFWMQGSKI